MVRGKLDRLAILVPLDLGFRLPFSLAVERHRVIFRHQNVARMFRDAGRPELGCGRKGENEKDYDGFKYANLGGIWGHESALSNGRSGKRVPSLVNFRHVSRRFESVKSVLLCCEVVDNAFQRSAPRIACPESVGWSFGGLR